MKEKILYPFAVPVVIIGAVFILLKEGVRRLFSQSDKEQQGPPV